MPFPLRFLNDRKATEWQIWITLVFLTDVAQVPKGKRNGPISTLLEQPMAVLERALWLTVLASLAEDEVCF